MANPNLAAQSTQDNPTWQDLFDFIEDIPDQRDETEWQDFLEYHAEVLR